MQQLELDVLNTQQRSVSWCLPRLAYVFKWCPGHHLPVLLPVLCWCLQEHEAAQASVAQDFNQLHSQWQCLVVLKALRMVTSAG